MSQRLYNHFSSMKSRQGVLRWLTSSVTPLAATPKIATWSHRKYWGAGFRILDV
jgi:hypothetical protein